MAFPFRCTPRSGQIFTSPSEEQKQKLTDEYIREATEKGEVVDRNALEIDFRYLAPEAIADEGNYPVAYQLIRK